MGNHRLNASRLRGTRVLIQLALAVIVCPLLFAGQMVSQVSAGTLIVTTTANSGPGSLQEAIGLAAPGDTITFAPSLNGGTIALDNSLPGFANNQLMIGKALSIVGPGAGLLTIDGGHAQRIFYIGAGDADRVNISGLTLTNGNALDCGGCYIDGGAIYIESGIVTLSNLVIADNQALRSAGALYISQRYFGDPPYEGVTNADVTLRNSVVRGNSASNVGAISLVTGKLRIERSTIHNNSAIATFTPDTGQGGGIVIGDGTFEMVNSTVSKNSADDGGSGIVIYNLNSTITSSTIINNRGDADGDGAEDNIEQAGIIGGKIKNSIIAGNLGANAQPDDCAYTISQGHNLFGDGTDCGPLAIGDLTLAALGLALDDVLDLELKLNAPGTTPTHALISGSLAIDAAAGGANCPATDQRGITRPRGTGCDIGAYEFSNVHTIALATTGAGNVSRSTPGPYAADDEVTLSATWDTATTRFAGWWVDGNQVGWSSPLILPIAGENHTVEAKFVALKSFPDVTANRPDYTAITELAARGYILGYTNGTYGPDNRVRREEMAALIARATPKSVADGASNLIVPPACTVVNSWDCEVWTDFTFKDIAQADPKLRRPMQVLAHYGVAKGYTNGNYGPKDNVTYAQTIAFITRAMIAKGYWVAQPAAPAPAVPIPDGLTLEVRTFAFYTGGIPAAPTTTAGWAAPATRGWFARALWAALNSYWGSNQLP